MAKEAKETIRIPLEIQAAIEIQADCLNISKNDVYKIALFWYLQQMKK